MTIEAYLAWPKIVASKFKLMIKRILPALLLVLCAGVARGQQVTITAGMKITKSTDIQKAIYTLDAPTDTSTSILLIQGDNIIVDFNNAELRGGVGKNPDQFGGVAVMIRNSKHVLIRNLKARGYKVALLA